MKSSYTKNRASNGFFFQTVLNFLDNCLCSSKLILEVTHVEDAKQSLVVPKNVPQITDFFSECPLFL